MSEIKDQDQDQYATQKIDDNQLIRAFRNRFLDVKNNQLH